MSAAIDAAREGLGLTRPNPPVGAVVVRNGKIVATGFHKKAGGPHAEVHALRQAGTRAQGAELYVTLEPCSTSGRTPPCTEAIVNAGIARVCMGSTDPNPAHQGRGVDLLRARRIRVATGICAAACDELIRPFAHHQQTGLPLVTLKLGTTLDGRIADRRNDSQWITGAEARARVQELRRSADGILVGATTARRDNPSLLPRPAYGRKPFRVVLDRGLDLPPRARIFSDGKATQTLVCCGPDAPAHKRRRIEQTGAEILEVAQRGNQLDLRQILRALGARGLLHLLCEGGGVLAGSLLRQQLVQEVWWFINPSLLGSDARPAIDGTGWLLARRPQFALHQTEVLGNDVLLRARPGGR